MLTGRAALACADVLLGLLRLTSARIGVAVVYHGVGDGSDAVLRTHAEGVFARQVAFLGDRWAVVPASRLMVAVETRRRGQRLPIAITFDDDLRCHLERAAPILRAHGLPATFFLTGASLTAPHTFWWQRLARATALGVDVQPPPGVPAGLGLPALARAVEGLAPAEREAWCNGPLAPFASPPADPGLRVDDVRALCAHGLEIGFHTRRHHPLPTLDDAGLATAMQEGRPQLEAAVGRPLTAIAYPHGMVDARVARIARAAGFTAGFTTRGAPARPGDDRLLIGRLEPSHVSLERFALTLARVMARAVLASTPSGPARA